MTRTVLLTPYRALFRRTRLDEDARGGHSRPPRSARSRLHEAWGNAGGRAPGRSTRVRRHRADERSVSRSERSEPRLGRCARPALRRAPAGEGAMVHGGGGAGAVARHRGEQHRVRADQRIDAARPAVCRSRSHRHDRHQPSWSRSSERWRVLLDLQDWAAAPRTFDGLAAVTETTMNVADERDP